MNNKKFYLFVIISLISLKSFSQTEKVWNWKNFIIVVKMQHSYIFYKNHHKYGLLTDTLNFVNDSTYIGQRWKLVINNNERNLIYGYNNLVMKLKLTNEKFLRRKKWIRELDLKY